MKRLAKRVDRFAASPPATESQLYRTMPPTRSSSDLASLSEAKAGLSLYTWTWWTACVALASIAATMLMRTYG